MNTMMASTLHGVADAKPKTSKHLMERKRRARINDSLLQLKSLVFPTLRKEIERHPKLEKADILEMTVRHIQDLQKQSGGGPSSPTNVSQFHAGFSECLSEVSRFLSNSESIELDTRLRILNHLADKCSTMPDPTVATERRVPSPHQHQQESVHHHRRSPVQRHSPYGYKMQSHHHHQSPVVDQRVPPMHGHIAPSQNNLVVVIPAETYPTTVSPASSIESSHSHSELYPTPPQSPVEDLYETPVHQYYSSAAMRTTVVPQQSRLPSTYTAVQMHVPVQRPVQVQEPVWRPW